MRYLWVYSAADAGVEAWHQRLLARRVAAGYDVTGYCITPPRINHRWFHFPELDARWRHGDPALLAVYAGLARALIGRDALVLYNGANIHPEFAATLECHRIYTCGDDPEATAVLSRPCSPPFDVHLVNHPGMVEVYRGWGCARVHFWPLGSTTFPEDVADLDEGRIRDRAARDLTGAYIGERNPVKRDRLDRLAAAFPDGLFRGLGWAGGTLPAAELGAVYRRARIGWNVHNSTGPINFRLYELAAHGVAQICDNAANLEQVFASDEAVGFTTIDQAIALSREILADPARQAELALRAHRRWRRDYHPDRVWERLVELTGEPARPGLVDAESLIAGLRQRTSSATARRWLWQAQRFAARATRRLRRMTGSRWNG
jgi:spore maturation protein CgeB